MNLLLNTTNQEADVLPVYNLSKSQYVLTIAEESGKVLTKRYGTLSKKKENIMLPMNGMQAGVYYVELETSEGIHSMRVIKR